MLLCGSISRSTSVMLSKCANLSCSARFRYLGEGRVFAVEHRSSTYARESDGGSEFEQIRREFRCFWLCPNCSQFMTVQACGAGGVRLAPSKNVLKTKAPSEDLITNSSTGRGCNMESKRKLNLLMKELQFLESGGYRLEMGWRPAMVFEDSPICPRLPHSVCPNIQCALLDFVPEEHHGQLVPCRYIPLNDAGETLQSLYNTATIDEIENAAGEWLTKKIEELKQSSDSRSIPAKRTAA
jgi:hypothetical protein